MDNPAQRKPLAMEAYLSNNKAVNTNPFEFYNRAHFAESALALAGLNQPGKSEEAVAQYKRLTFMLPGYWLAHFLLGRAYGETEQPELAIEAYNQAIRLNPESILTLNERARTHTTRGDYTSAIEDYGEIISIEPRRDSAFLQRALALFALGRFEDAASDFDTAIDLIGKQFRAAEDPGEAMGLQTHLALVHNNRGAVSEELARTDQAIEDFNEAIRLSPSFREAYINRGLAFAGVGRAAEAKRDFRRAEDLRLDLSFLGIDPEFLGSQQ